MASLQLVMPAPGVCQAPPGARYACGESLGGPGRRIVAGATGGLGAQPSVRPGRPGDRKGRPRGRVLERKKALFDARDDELEAGQHGIDPADEDLELGAAGLVVGVLERLVRP